MFAGRTPRAAAGVLAAGVLGLAACAGCAAEDDASPARPSDSTVTTATAAPESPTATASSAAPTVTASSTAPTTSTTPTGRKLVTMTVTGGFAGVHQELVLRDDGTVHTVEKGEREVRRTDEATFTHLRTLLGDPALDEVPDVTVDRGAADMFLYTLDLDGRTVVTDRSSEQPALDRLVDALGAWLPQR